MALISSSKYHRTVNGTELTRAREEVSLTQEEFAEKCEWSQQFQSQIEAPGEHEITTEAATKILYIFLNLGFNSVI